MKKWIEIGNSFYNLDEIQWVENDENTNIITIVFKNTNHANLQFNNTDKCARDETYEKIKKELLE